MEDLWKYEKEGYALGYQVIAGVDEVGRGPLVGPVVTACVVLPKDFVLEGLTDSKKLSPKKREIFYDYIIKHATGYAIGSASAAEIDEINIYNASKLAMERAIASLRESLNIDYVLTDAMKLDIDIPHLPIIKGDAKSITIAAASVVAKVTRDRMMDELDSKYPMYGFKKHKGYPTKAHIEALNKYGVIAGYRKTYGPVKKFYEDYQK